MSLDTLNNHNVIYISCDTHTAQAHTVHSQYTHDSDDTVHGKMYLQCNCKGLYRAIFALRHALNALALHSYCARVMSASRERIHIEFTALILHYHYASMALLCRL